MYLSKFMYYFNNFIYFNQTFVCLVIYLMWANLFIYFNQF